MFYHCSHWWLKSNCASSLWKINRRGLNIEEPSRNTAECYRFWKAEPIRTYVKRTSRVATYATPVASNFDRWLPNRRRRSLSAWSALHVAEAVDWISSDSRLRRLYSRGTIPTHGVQPANYSSKHAGTHTWCREPQVSNQDERDKHTRERKSDRGGGRGRENCVGFGASYTREIRCWGRYSIISVILCITERCVSDKKKSRSFPVDTRMTNANLTFRYDNDRGDWIKGEIPSVCRIHRKRKLDRSVLSVAYIFSLWLLKTFSN